ncbi:MAG: DNA-deoxyinosine glycosylase [Chloroflexia bacterium]|nr:DNA-deoxyinosine glycosylase [Chloroflexia bacterium]
MRSISFDAIIPENAKILILGTMPGIKSLEEHEYYAHDRNAFWPMMFAIFNNDFSIDYKTRISLLKNKKIALWDTLKLCYREGSLDSNIKNAEPNEIIGFLERNQTIKHVLFNGKGAEKYYEKFHDRIPGINYYSMPSTSPANARFKFEDKLNAWQIIKELL